MGEVGRAKEIMEDMKRGDKGRLLDKVAVTTVINGLVSKGKVEEAMGVFSEGAFYGIVYDLPAYNMVLMGLMRSKNYERAEAMVERMEESGVKPNFMTYS